MLCSNVSYASRSAELSFGVNQDALLMSFSTQRSDGEGQGWTGGREKESRTVIEWIDDAQVANRSMTAAETLEELVLVDEAGRSIRLVRRLNANAQLCVVEVHTVEFEKADEHVTEVGVFDCTVRAARRATATIATIATAETIVEMIIIEIAVVVTTAIVII